MAIFEETIEEGVAVSDAPEAVDSDEFVRELFQDICEAVFRRQALSKAQRAIFDRHAENVASEFRRIRTIADRQSRNDALRFAISALSVGYFHPGDPDLLEELRSDFQKKQMAPMLLGHVRPDIQGIIDRFAVEYRARYPSFVSNHLGTAHKIYDAVCNEVDALESPPRWWRQKENETLEQAKRRRIEVIRKRISRGG